MKWLVCIDGTIVNLDETYGLIVRPRPGPQEIWELAALGHEVGSQLSVAPQGGPNLLAPDQGQPVAVGQRQSVQWCVAYGDKELVEKVREELIRRLATRESGPVFDARKWGPLAKVLEYEQVAAAAEDRAIAIAHGNGNVIPLGEPDGGRRGD